MADLLEPIPGDDPCGPDLQWDPAMLALDQALASAVSEKVDVVEGSRADEDDSELSEVVRMAEELCERTKDLRVMCTLAEAQWRVAGVGAFLEVFHDLLQAVNTWPDPDAGIHPRADEEDGDLGLRAAPVAGLLLKVPVLVRTIGWGRGGEPDADGRTESALVLGSAMDTWNELEPAFGGDLPSIAAASTALNELVVVDELPDLVEEDDDAAPGERVRAAEPDYWTQLERAAAQMERITPQSPVLPVVRMALTWREKDLIQIADAMRPSGITLEQLLNSAKTQLDAAASA